MDHSASASTSPTSLIRLFTYSSKKRGWHNKLIEPYFAKSKSPNSFFHDRNPNFSTMSMLVVDCSNCHTPLNLPPGARSIRCALCQAVTSIADSGGSSLPSSPSGVHPFPGLTMHMPPYNHAPMSVSGMSPFPGLATDMASPSPYNHAPPSVHGRKKAVIVGVSYKFTRHELKGCINDAKYMKHLLISRFQFPEASIIMLTGKNPNLCVIKLN